MSPMPHDEETFPPSKLGEYKVVKDIAEGTFGKVKSVYRFQHLPLATTNVLSTSGRTHHHRPAGSDEVPFEGDDLCDKDEDKSAERG